MCETWSLFVKEIQDSTRVQNKWSNFQWQITDFCDKSQPSCSDLNQSAHNTHIRACSAEQKSNPDVQFWAWLPSLYCTYIFPLNLIFCTSFWCRKFKKAISTKFHKTTLSSSCHYYAKYLINFYEKLNSFFIITRSFCLHFYERGTYLHNNSYTLNVFKILFGISFGFCVKKSTYQLSDPRT